MLNKQVMAFHAASCHGLSSSRTQIHSIRLAGLSRAVLRSPHPVVAQRRLLHNAQWARREAPVQDDEEQVYQHVLKVSSS